MGGGCRLDNRGAFGFGGHPGRAAISGHKVDQELDVQGFGDANERVERGQMFARLQSGDGRLGHSEATPEGRLRQTMLGSVGYEAEGDGAGGGKPVPFDPEPGVFQPIGK